jgi:hypothetical protein
MFFQTLLQTLLGKRKKTTKTVPEKELSPMAQSIMQKLAEHEKNSVADPKTTDSKENPNTN